VLRQCLVMGLIFSSIACAPLVSRRKRSEPAPAAVARPVAEKAVERVTPPPPPRREEEKPAVVVREEPPATPEIPVEAAPAEEASYEAPAPKERTTFYAFTDKEIQKLKMRSKKFRQLAEKHKKCASKTEKMIMRREELREQIIELQNMEGRTSQEEKRLASLRAEERRMKQDKKSLATCEPLEKKLTEMLQSEYGTTASLDEGVY
jgi:hypothetical protein